MPSREIAFRILATVRIDPADGSAPFEVRDTFSTHATDAPSAVTAIAGDVLTRRYAPDSASLMYLEVRR